MEDYTIVIEVLGDPKETCISVNKLSDLDLELLYPMIKDIENHLGYYPKGKYIRPDRPTARDLYHNYQAWDIFESMIPKNNSGFSAIRKISLFKNPILDLKMI